MTIVHLRRPGDCGLVLDCTGSRLPRVLHPGDTVEAEVPLVPPAALDRLGPWELAIVPLTDRGTEIPLDAPCTVRVLATPGHTSE